MFTLGIMNANTKWGGGGVQIYDYHLRTKPDIIYMNQKNVLKRFTNKRTIKRQIMNAFR